MHFAADSVPHKILDQTKTCPFDEAANNARDFGPSRTAIHFMDGRLKRRLADFEQPLL